MLLSLNSPNCTAVAEPRWLWLVMAHLRRGEFDWSWVNIYTTYAASWSFTSSETLPVPSTAFFPSPEFRPLWFSSSLCFFLPILGQDFYFVRTNFGVYSQRRIPYGTQTILVKNRSLLSIEFFATRSRELRRMLLSIGLLAFIPSILILQALCQNSVQTFNWKFASTIDVSVSDFLGLNWSINTNTMIQPLRIIVTSPTNMSGNSYRCLSYALQFDCRRFFRYTTILHDGVSWEWATHHERSAKRHWHVGLDSNSPRWLVSCTKMQDLY